MIAGSAALQFATEVLCETDPSAIGFRIDADLTAPLLSGLACRWPPSDEILGQKGDYERMITLDEEFLAGLGLGDLPCDDQRGLLEAIYQQLELDVGLRLTERLSREELQEFNALMDAGDEDEALAWLQLHAPDYQELVRAALDE